MPPVDPASPAGPVTLARLAARLGAPLPDSRDAGVVLTGLTHDSHAVRPGDGYAALPGARNHGARFATDAVAAGAVAVLTDAAGERVAAGCGVPVLVLPDPRAALGEAAACVHGDPARDLLLLGVTGTNGKTTTTYLLESGLRAAGHVTGLVGTIETRVRDEVVPSVRTTPEATDLHALLARMRDAGVTAVAMEVSSHALALGRVGGIRFDVAAFTNLSQDHLDFHGSLEEYFRAKASLFRPERARQAVVCVDDDFGRRLAAQSGVPVTTVAVARSGARWLAQDLVASEAGTEFVVVGPSGEKAAARVAIPGVFNVANALVALVGLVAAGVPLPVAVDGVAACHGVPGRMERVDAGQPFLAVVDYAHTPEAVATLLATLRDVTRGRLVVVLGAGGNRDREKRRPMGAAAARLADLVVLTSDNPRDEDPLAILDALDEGTREVTAGLRAGVVVEPDRSAAIALAVGRAAPGDTLVVAGKGHETGQEVAGVVRPFDDRAVLRAALRERGAS